RSGGFALEQVAWSLASRSVFEHRAGVVGSSVEQMLSGLDALATGLPAGNVVTGVASGSARSVWVFPGQGGQSVKMAAGLVGNCPGFDKAIGEGPQAVASELAVC